MEILTAWLPPAVIIAVILFTSNLTNKRIDDLRTQMSREHDNLTKKVDAIDVKLSEHLTNYDVHSMQSG
ncbi:MAG: hypothetical protein OXN17_07795 [Candidatus Poribacteria bacterium]|nr:hypothetical protein [Candidatus Poribacteria bacterium]MDE0503210.1 hypothetical protein [Candidatus Poribacteria bacterium]